MLNVQKAVMNDKRSQFSVIVTDVTCEVKVEYSVTSKETKKLSEFHQISKLWDFQPLAAKPTAKYHIRVVFSIKLLLKLIWLKVSSAFNLGQR